MGTYVELKVAGLDVDWGKNEYFSDHGPLFQTQDLVDLSDGSMVQTVAGESVLYRSEGFSKPLGHVQSRLELLGHTKDTIRSKYLWYLAKNWHDPDDPLLNYDKVSSAFASINFNNIPPDYRNFVDDDAWQIVAQRLVADANIKDVEEARVTCARLGDVFAGLDPLDILYWIADNPANLDLPVTWHVSDNIDSGWSSWSDVEAGAEPSQSFLIVTEGSSDTYIIKKAFSLIRPEIEDFFEFIDMEDNYPFTGTGNLHNFVKGLSKIGIQNQVIVVYDNDTEGNQKFQESAGLYLPDNLKVMKLPDIPSMLSLKTIGPSGVSVQDVNGLAASIESFLDFNSVKKEPIIRWTTYNKVMDAYQGELDCKTKYTKAFMNPKVNASSYDLSKLVSLLDAIVRKAIEISSQKHGLTYSI